MSRENVAIVKRAIDAYNRLDIDSFDAVATVDIELFSPMFDQRSFLGREGIEMLQERIRDTWAGLPTIGDDFRDLGEHVLVLGRIEGRGRGSGAPVDTSVGLVFDLRGGKISRIRSYLDHGEALRAAGLAE